MAERIADNAEHIVDEMKRRARRRLVGAIVLALAAAIVVPMLLEKEPRPLGDDVSVRIPPVDESKFVNRLTGKADEAKPLPKADAGANAGVAVGKSEPKTEVPAPAGPSADAAASTEAPVPKESVSAAEQRVIAPAAKTVPKAEARPAAANEPRVEAKAAPKPEPRAAPAPEPKGGPASTAAAKPPAAAAPPTPPGSPEGFVVQLAAFADDKGASALANKLKKSGYAAYVQPVETSRGTLWRVRVGGYGSRPEADGARAKLKGEGYSGIVAPAQ
jgi:DedD protein